VAAPLGVAARAVIGARAAEAREEAVEGAGGAAVAVEGDRGAGEEDGERRRALMQLAQPRHQDDADLPRRREGGVGVGVGGGGGEVGEVDVGLANEAGLVVAGELAAVPDGDDERGGDGGVDGGADGEDEGVAVAVGRP
jgi:hypothetical protein